MCEPARSLFDELRRLHNRLLQIVEELHGGAISAPQRAVLEYLHEHGPSTVPAVARSRNVSRQHIQGIVNSLAEQKWVDATANAAHRRSPLYVLTDSGRTVIADVLARETDYLADRLGDLDAAQLRAAAQVLSSIRHRL
jgi:DNA-binding MarR family transcriptional regulator